MQMALRVFFVIRIFRMKIDSLCVMFNSSTGSFSSGFNAYQSWVAKAENEDYIYLWNRISVTTF